RNQSRYRQSGSPKTGPSTPAPGRPQNSAGSYSCRYPMLRRCRRRLRTVPNLPGRDRQVQFIQVLLVLKSVHALPEAAVFIGQQRFLLDQPLEWLPHQLFTGMNVVKNFAAHGEESAVDPNIGA